MEMESIDSTLTDKQEEICSQTKAETMSHKEAMAFFKSKIASLMETDPLLKSISAGSRVTLEELNSLLALEHGRAITVNICKADQESYQVIVEQKATVLDLKKAIQRHVTLKLEREGNERYVSWRYVWKTYWLYFEGQKLVKDNKPLKDYGIYNGSYIRFVKRLRKQ